MQIETRIITTETNPDEIDAWVARAFEGVDIEDMRLNNRDELGSDDVPHLSLIQETPESQRQVWGEWSCHREIRWADHDGDPRGSVWTDRGLMSAGQYAVGFARQNNMRVKLTLRWPCWAVA